MISNDDRHRSTFDRSVKVFRPVSQHPARAVHGGIRTPARVDALVAEEYGKSGVLPMLRDLTTRYLRPEPGRLPTESRACVPARFYHKQPQKMREISRCDEPVRGAAGERARAVGRQGGWWCWWWQRG